MNYPEHEKLSAIKAESQPQGEFLEWLEENNMCIAYWDESIDTWMPVRKNTNQILAEYHGIDLKRLEGEKMAMLEEFRSATS